MKHHSKIQLKILKQFMIFSWLNHLFISFNNPLHASHMIETFKDRMRREKIDRSIFFPFCIFFFSFHSLFWRSVGEGEHLSWIEGFQVPIGVFASSKWDVVWVVAVWVGPLGIWEFNLGIFCRVWGFLIERILVWP